MHLGRRIEEVSLPDLPDEEGTVNAKHCKRVQPTNLGRIRHMLTERFQLMPRKRRHLPLVRKRPLTPHKDMMKCDFVLLITLCAFNLIDPQ